VVRFQAAETRANGKALRRALHRNGRKTIRALIVITSSSWFGNLSTTHVESETSYDVCCIIFQCFKIRDHIRGNFGTASVV